MNLIGLNLWQLQYRNVYLVFYLLKTKAFLASRCFSPLYTQRTVPLRAKEGIKQVIDRYYYQLIKLHENYIYIIFYSAEPRHWGKACWALRGFLKLFFSEFCIPADYLCHFWPLLPEWQHRIVQPPDRSTKGFAPWNWRQEDPWLLVGNGQHVRLIWDLIFSSIIWNFFSLIKSDFPLGASCSPKYIWLLMQTSEFLLHNSEAAAIGFILLLFPCPLTRYKHYERWATANDFPVENVVNDGSTTLEDRLGAVADLELVIRSRMLQDDIMVVCGICIAVNLCGRLYFTLRTFSVFRLQVTCYVRTRTLTLLRLSDSSGQRWESK